MHLKTWRVGIAGITTNPGSSWMQQVCRNLTDFEDRFLRDVSYLLFYRDGGFIVILEFIDMN